MSYASDHFVFLHNLCHCRYWLEFPELVEDGKCLEEFQELEADDRHEEEVDDATQDELIGDHDTAESRSNITTPPSAKTQVLVAGISICTFC